ncbi:hypothetical protein N7456_009350 [Penicillium angulare]|uniref:Uncharacterized protein n=1 Tax=Penicillium angulare TaxID=116970 RepID=A0A9W9F4J7_9EURO|nr:hypothetical protein N7456_009350 [Penicillium angulare]
MNKDEGQKVNDAMRIKKKIREARRWDLSGTWLPSDSTCLDLQNCKQLPQVLCQNVGGRVACLIFIRHDTVLISTIHIIFIRHDTVHIIFIRHDTVHIFIAVEVHFHDVVSLVVGKLLLQLSDHRLQVCVISLSVIQFGLQQLYLVAAPFERLQNQLLSDISQFLGQDVVAFLVLGNRFVGGAVCLQQFVDLATNHRDLICHPFDLLLESSVLLLSLGIFGLACCSQLTTLSLNPSKLLLEPLNLLLSLSIGSLTCCNNLAVLSPNPSKLLLEMFDQLLGFGAGSLAYHRCLALLFGIMSLLGEDILAGVRLLHFLLQSFDSSLGSVKLSSPLFQSLLHRDLLLSHPVVDTLHMLQIKGQIFHWRSHGTTMSDLCMDFSIAYLDTPLVDMIDNDIFAFCSGVLLSFVLSNLLPKQINLAYIALVLGTADLDLANVDMFRQGRIAFSIGGHPSLNPSLLNKSFDLLSERVNLLLVFLLLTLQLPLHLIEIVDEPEVLSDHGNVIHVKWIAPTAFKLLYSPPLIKLRLAEKGDEDETRHHQLDVAAEKGLLHYCDGIAEKGEDDETRHHHCGGVAEKGLLHYRDGIAKKGDEDETQHHHCGGVAEK